MVKTIRKTIQITTRKRNHGVKINEEFYSYDKNNAQFEFIMDYDIPADKVIALFHFENTNRYYETLCQFKGNLITIEFDTSLIVEDELVTGYLYFDKLEKSTDVYRFTFGARVSEIDKTRELPVQEKVSRRIVPVADIVTKQELDELLAGIKKNGETYDDSALSGRVSALEVKQDKDTLYYTNIDGRLTNLENHTFVNISNFVTNEALENKHYVTDEQISSTYATKSEIPQQYSDTELVERITVLENKPPVDISNLATKEELAAVRNIDTSNLVTKQELEDKHYIQDVSNLATNEKVTAVENRVQALETDTNEFARKSEIPQPYNDSALTERVNLLEAKAIANGAYDDKPLLDKIHAIEEKSNAAITAHQSLEHLVTRDELEEKHYLTSVPEEYAKKSDLSNLATNTKVEAVENRVQVLENKSVVTHEELEQAGYAKQSEIVTKEELASKNYLTEYPSLDGYAKKTDLVDTSLFVSKEELESKGYIHDVSGLATKQELEAAKASIPQPYNDTEIRGQLARKVDTDTLATLATKQELQTNDEEVKRRLTTLEGKTDNFITGVSVNKEGSNVTLTYNYVDGQSKNVSFTDSDTINVAYDDSDLRNRVVALETKEDKDTKYDDTEVKRRLTELESKPTVDTSVFVTEEKLNSKGYITDISRLATKEELAKAVTKEELEGKNYVTEEQLNNKAYLTQQNLDNYALKSELPQPYNDGPLNERVTALENKPTTHFVTKQELEDKHYLNDISNLATKLELQDKVNKSDFDTLKSDVVKRNELVERHYLTETTASETYAKKSELPTPYNDSALVNRISALESKQDKDTVYNDTEVKQRLTNLENRPQVDVTKLVSKDELPNLIPHQSLENYALKSELYNDRELKEKVISLESDDKDLKNRVTNLEKSAQLVTEVSDKVKALEKSPVAGGGSKQDTGWITIKDGTDTFSQIVKIRRIDNMVHVQIASNSPDGLSIDFANIDMVQHLMPQLGFNTSTDVIVPITYSQAYLSDNPTYTNINGLAVIRVMNGELRIKVYSESFSSVGEHCHINSVSYFTEDPFPNDLTGLD